MRQILKKLLGHSKYAISCFLIYFSLFENTISPKLDFTCSGYISPEYAVNGLFSIKSDVFSFGVIVLEIVSGKKNREFYHADHTHNLLGHVRIKKFY